MPREKAVAVGLGPGSTVSGGAAPAGGAGEEPGGGPESAAGDRGELVGGHGPAVQLQQPGQGGGGSTAIDRTRFL